MQENISSIQSEVDAIIARAMAEYSAAKGVDVFANNSPTPEETHVEEEPLVEESEVHQEIPVNSNSLLVEESTSRFSSAIWFDNIKQKSVILAGLGGIGSYVAFLLGRLHVANIALFDDDVVEEGNMSGQLYASSYVGQEKVFATQAILGNFANYYDVNVFPERYTENSISGDIMICGFDNMVARRTFFESWLRHVREVEAEGGDSSACLFIDGRLAAESFQVFCIKGGDEYNITKYHEQFLFRDEEAEETICSYKQTTFMANMIGSVIVNLFVNFCANQCSPLIPRDLPFLTEYSADTMFFKVTN